MLLIMRLNKIKPLFYFFDIIFGGSGSLVKDIHSSNSSDTRSSNSIRSIRSIRSSSSSSSSIP